jgi:hypothetical protein
VAAGLAVLEPETVNILVVAGIGAMTPRPMCCHPEATENDGKERMAVIGVTDDRFTNLVLEDTSRTRGSFSWLLYQGGRCGVTHAGGARRLHRGVGRRTTLDLGVHISDE